MGYTEGQGIKAIIALQKMAGITESEDRAKRSWRNFKDWEKKQTERAHKMFCGGFPEDGKSN
jgi:hypothetical protein